ncbi:MAG TPA: hypothetical protein VHW23_21260 [Kofleriaceae bacterium]|nr:hypothetical protein [Kofleriaceae bacterium]
MAAQLADRAAGRDPAGSDGPIPGFGDVVDLARQWPQPGAARGDVLARYTQLRRVVPADYATLERAAEAGTSARIELALHVLLPAALHYRERSAVLAELPAVVGDGGPLPDAERWVAETADNEALRRFIAGRLLEGVAVEYVPSQGRLQFSSNGVILPAEPEGTLGLAALDVLAAVPFATLLADEIQAARQLVAIQDLARRTQTVTAGALPALDQIIVAPERFALNDVAALRKSVLDIVDLAPHAIAQLHASNADQRARLVGMQAVLEVARAAAATAWTAITACQQRHHPDERAGELYDEFAADEYSQGGLHYVSGASYDLWHFAGNFLTFGSMNRRAANARAYRHGEISLDAFEENDAWDMLATTVTAVITALTLGLGAELAAGTFAVSAGYTAAGSAIMTGTVVGATASAGDAIAQDALALLASHVSSNPYVQAYQRARIGGPLQWLQAGLIGAMAGGGTAGLFAKLAQWLRLGRVPTDPEPTADPKATRSAGPEIRPEPEIPRFEFEPALVEPLPADIREAFKLAIQRLGRVQGQAARAALWSRQVELIRANDPNWWAVPKHTSDGSFFWEGIREPNMLAIDPEGRVWRARTVEARTVADEPQWLPMSRTVTPNYDKMTLAVP